MMAGKKLLVGLTGFRESHWKSKLREINELGLKEISLFLEQFRRRQREKIYDGLRESCVKKIPLVHVRHDMTKDELELLSREFGSKYFTIHEEGFRTMERWRGFYRELYLEMNFDDFISKFVEVGKIGGFCIDLSHFKAEEERWTDEFEYIIDRRRVSRYFACNHLNGYNPGKKRDMHKINNLKNFDYLTSLPKFVFGKVIGIETYNSIKEQMEFKDYLKDLVSF